MKEIELLNVYLVFDLLFLNGAMLLVWSLGGDFFRHQPIEYYLIHSNTSWVIAYFLLSKKNLYLRDGFANRFYRIFQRTGLFFMVGLLLAFLTDRALFSIRAFALYSVVFCGFKVVFYWLLYRYMLRRRERGEHVLNCAIVGRNATAEHLRQLMDCNPILGYKCAGYIDTELGFEEGRLGTMADFERVSLEHGLQTVFVCASYSPEMERQWKLLEVCRSRGIRVRFVSNGLNWGVMHNTESIAGIPLYDPMQVPLDSMVARFWKRLFDIVFSVVIIVLVLSWMTPLIVLLQCLSCRGPLFFVQERTGANNRTFKCLKFRSMCVNSEADVRQASAHDERITRCGRWMRKYNLDELPQFVNVLLGDMSVVGPRPHMLAHTEQYSALIDTYLQRHFVKPGITGWAQVNGFRGETDALWKMEKRVEFDMEYIQHWSVWLDLQIILMTLFGIKAYKNAG